MENEEIKVSVVIPVYNTEKYVREAVESIMNQTLRELEIIIINDGSTDNSLQVVEELAAADSRIQVYSQANQGGSVARNAGIARAYGKYIYFMDSDDLLEKETIDLCYRKCEEEQLDFVFFDAETFIDGNVENAPALSYKHTGKLEDKVYTGIEAFKIQLDNNEFTPSPCLSFIRCSFLKEHHILFYPGIIHEDQLFTVTLYLQAERTGRIHHSFFHRRLRENSIMTCDFSLKNLKGYLTVTREIVKFKQQTSEKKNQGYY
ncbi:glycosyltransferase [Bacteroides thetaiotaomicron]|uniref:glycosyltransferase n=1 Tax=Bacteroides thetaiotaomicron TaxID=818 RepID=UPI0039C18D68